VHGLGSNHVDVVKNALKLFHYVLESKGTLEIPVNVHSDIALSMLKCGLGMKGELLRKQGIIIMLMMCKVGFIFHGLEVNGCASCFVEMDDLYMCAGCKMAKYCSAECQRKDWTNELHKPFCHMWRTQLSVAPHLNEINN
jgi:hypothetical protein